MATELQAITFSAIFRQWNFDFDKFFIDDCVTDDKHDKSSLL